jgi:hypothetical protein
MKVLQFLRKRGFQYNLEYPKPSSEFIPEWFRKAESFIEIETGLIANIDQQGISGGLKSCMPFLDALSSGYMMVSVANIRITKNENDVVEWEYVEKDKNGEWQVTDIDWTQIAERHGDIGHTIPRPYGFANNHLVWTNHWGMKLPKGWSVLATHPLNRTDLPYYTLSGIVDSDRFAPNGNLPFFIKDGWLGVIERGAPLVQLIPIKRSTWVSKVGHLNEMDHFFGHEARNIAYGYYRKNMWVPKKYKRGKDEVE